MQTSIVDLRYKMSDILKALDKRELVNILYHGKLKAIIIPAHTKPSCSIKEHPMFGILRKSKESVAHLMNKLRENRYHDI